MGIKLIVVNLQSITTKLLNNDARKISNDLTLITEAVTSVVEPIAIYLFGSYAYGTPNEDSDIDIYVVVPDSVVDIIELNAQIRYALFYKQKNR